MKISVFTFGVCAHVIAAFVPSHVRRRPRRHQFVRVIATSHGTSNVGAAEAAERFGSDERRHHHRHYHHDASSSAFTNKNDEHVDDDGSSPTCLQSRRGWIQRTAARARTTLVAAPSLVLAARASLLGTAVAAPQPAHALVKGVAPPPPRSKTDNNNKPKCTNIEECQAMAEKRQQEQAAAFLDENDPPQTTAGGTRYRDLTVGKGRTAKEGDQVTLSYKVLKLGKRSFDGLSGEGTVVFSRGYALEDDESVPGDKTFITTLGSPINIVALNEAVAGMQTGGVRRFSVFPPKGWRKPGSACDGGPGGSGAGGELRTDYGTCAGATDDMTRRIRSYLRAFLNH